MDEPDDSIDEPADNTDLPLDLPKPAVGRMSLYFRELQRLLDSDVVSINSQELGQMVDISPAVVRRDLSTLGTIGRRGVGYDIAVLMERIGGVLGSTVQWNVVLVGVGSLGDALLRYRGFERLGLRLSAAFDNDPAKIGTSIGGIEVIDANQIETVLAADPAELAILLEILPIITLQRVFTPSVRSYSSKKVLSSKSLRSKMVVAKLASSLTTYMSTMGTFTAQASVPGSS